MLIDPLEVVSEREAFLLRELQAMFLRDKLLSSENDVLVVAARNAWPEYQDFYVYICQPERSFQLVERIAFYSDGQIHPLVPRILKIVEAVQITPESYDEDLRGLAERLMDSVAVREVLHEQVRSRYAVAKRLIDNGVVGNEQVKVMFLSPPNSSETVNLGRSIANDLLSDSGRPSAYTQGHRYASLSRLKSALKTSDLVDASR